MTDKKLPPQEEEVDLGNLFKVIGKGISNLLNVILQFFISIFHYFILLLIFLKNHAIKLGLALLIGFIVGLIIHKIGPKSYVSDMVVETNYGSGMQLYKQIDYLNNLVKKKDSISLAQVLNIKAIEAAKISRLGVSAYQPERNLYNAYDEYLKETDSIYTRNFKFEDFKKRVDEYDFRYHQIEVESESNNIFTKLTSGIINLVENDYFKNKRDIKLKELNQKLDILNNNLIQIDSLRKTYKEVSIKEAEKLTNSSTIEISKSDSKKDENDIKLFETSNELLNNISWTNEDLVRKNNVVNIISNFDQVGVPDKNITHKKYFQFPLLFFGFMLAWILIKKLNHYLENYN